jgi:hypothetical protein
VSAADAGPAWSAWAQITPVASARAPADRYLRLRIPPSIGPGPDGSYPDLRVVDRAGAETPYAVDPQRASPTERIIPLIDLGFVPRRGTQGVADLGPAGTLVDAIALEIDARRRPTYFARVAIDASDDRRTWRIVRDDAIVYRVAQDGGRGNTAVAIPPTRSRWLRVRVFEPNQAFPLTGARIAATASREPPLVVLPVVAVRTSDTDAHAQRWTFTAPNPIRPTAASFADGGAFYKRTVSVESSDDGQRWSSLAEAAIAHYAEGGAETTLALSEVTTSYVRVTVYDGNNAPVRSLRPMLLARPHEIVFAGGAAPYRLLSGNPAAAAPSYDLGARLAHEKWRAQPADAGDTNPSAGYRDPRPVGERFPWLLTGVLIAVAIALGGVAVLTLRRPAAE